MTIKLKLRKKILICASIICAFFFYILSYSFMLPLLEQADLGRIGYVLYEPVEIFRNNSKMFWGLTEHIYRFCGGRKAPQKRYFFLSSTRRNLEWYDNGVLKEDSFSKGEQVYDLTFWYENGNVGEKFKIGNNNFEFIKKNKIGVTIYFHSITNGNGIIKWFNNAGKEIAKVEVRNNKPWNGTVVRAKKENGKIIEYLVEIKRGKETSEPYPIGSQPK